MMRIIIAFLLFLFSLSALGRQVILILLPHHNEHSIHARLWAFENKRLVFKNIPVVLGKNGAIVHKIEGDNKTPIGVFSIKTAFGFSRRSLNPHFPYRWIRKDTEAVDDVNSSYYNQIVDADSVSKKDWDSSEKMHDIPLYRVGLQIAYNPKNIRGKGSLIFMHIWHGPNRPTAGCIGMSTMNINRLILWLKKREHPLVIITRGQK